MSAAYFLGSRLLAVSQVPFLWDDTREAEVSQLYLCPTCGEVWARVAVTDTRWVAHRQGCIRHPSFGSDVGGSFIQPWRRNISDLPEEVLQYELAIRLVNYPKETPA
jgi:hypothetical protein